ncbi:MAG: hypothetical protein WBI74_09295 [Caldicoprobacterales bacterium]|nr:hypothetical protein [Clostridiales bacterium]
MINNNFTRYSSREGLIVEKWVNNTYWLRHRVEKYEPNNTGFHDYKVRLISGEEFIVEVKEEEYYWYNKTGNIGLDFISVFYFTDKARELHWKQAMKYWVPSNRIDNFLKNDIIVSKWGKLKTCDAHVQLFYVENANKTILLEAYNNFKLQNKEFINYLKSNYRLRINKKSDYNLGDYWESAAFFIKPRDKRLRECKINSFNDLLTCIRH